MKASLFLLMISVLVSANGRTTELEPAELGAWVDGFVIGRMLDEGVVGVTVAIVKDGQRIFSRGYGYDDLEAQRPVDSSRSMFRPGSISKTFTWTAVMQLHEQGKLDLEKDIQEYLPNVVIPKTFDTPITLLDLMAHRPGFEESALGHLIGNRPEAVLPLVDYLNSHQPKRVYPPGEVPAYSNYGSGLAGLIIANVSDMPFEDYIEQKVLLPLGMIHSTFREPWGDQRPGAMPESMKDNVSKGYSRVGGEYESTAFEFIGHLGPAGALSTTADDMALWMLAHLGNGAVTDEAGGERRILQTDTAQLMHSRHRTLDARLPGIAHGFVEATVHGYPTYGHSGGTVHFLSDMIMIPEIGLGVFISTNTSIGGGKVMNGFVRALVTRFFPPGPDFIDLPATHIDASPDLVGSYILSRRAHSTVEKMAFPVVSVQRAKHGDLLIGGLGGEPSRYVAIAADHFRSVTDTGSQLIFERDQAGHITRLLTSIPITIGTPAGPLERPDTVYGALFLCALVFVGVLLGIWHRSGRGLVSTPQERRVMWLTGGMAAIWLIALALMAIGSLAISDPRNIFFNFPGIAFMAGLWGILLAVLLTLLAAVFTPSALSNGTWTLRRRIRHVLVIVTAGVIVWILWTLNAIGFNYF